MSQTEKTLLPDFQRTCQQIGQLVVQRGKVSAEISRLEGQLTGIEIALHAATTRAAEMDAATPHARRVEDALGEGDRRATDDLRQQARDMGLHGE